LLGRALALEMLDKREEALRDLDAALKLDPRSTAVRNSRGTFFFRGDDTEAAIAEYEEAIKLDPKLDIAFFNRSLVYKDQGRYDRALRDLNASLALAPGDAMSLMQKGDIYRLLEDYLLAVDYLDAAIKADSELGRAYRWRSLAKAALADAAGAKADAEKADQLGAEAE
jgi:tetratricopeptide (TPR) repeat protein